MQRERDEQIDLVETDLKTDDTQSSVSSTAPADLPYFGDQYETLELIGQGGMGSVYKVRDKRDKSCFAIKLLNPDLAKDKTAVKRFEKEAEATSKLTHENLVTVYEHGCTDNGIPYIVMEFLGDQNLAEFINAKKKLEADEAIPILSQICDALSYAHKAGIVHRDLKPSNIILSELNRTAGPGSNELKLETNSDDPHKYIVKVADFGIASIKNETAPAGETLTKTGEIIGSPLYMSPEQCVGNALDASSDIYSFGCVMYTTLTGRAPFEGSNPVQIILKQIQEKAPPLPPGIRVGKNIQLEKIIHRCLQKDKENRYKTVDEIKIDLARAAAGRLVESVNPRLMSASEERALVIFTVALFAIPIVFGTIMKLFSPPQTTSPPAIVQQLEGAKPAPVTALAPQQAPDLTAERALKHFKAREFDEAIPLLQYVAATAKREGKLEFEAFIYQCIGQSYLALKQYDKAEVEYKKSIKMFGDLRHSNNEQLQNDGVITEATTGYIEVLRALNKSNEAMKLLKSMNLQRLRDLENFYQSFPPEDLKRVHDLRVELEAIRAAETKPVN